MKIARNPEKDSEGRYTFTFSVRAEELELLLRILRHTYLSTRGRFELMPARGRLKPMIASLIAALNWHKHN